MKLEIIAAVSDRLVIGMKNRLPWHLPPDFKRFRSITCNHSIIMGRRTWEGLSGPLESRQNIIVSGTLRREDLPEGIVLASDFRQALSMVNMPSPAFAIGGSEIYREALRYAQRMHITEIHHDFPGDVFFPKFYGAEWIEEQRTSFEATCTVPFSYDFVEYSRR